MCMCCVFLSVCVICVLYVFVMYMCVVCLCVYVIYVCCFVYMCVGHDLETADNRNRDNKSLEAGVGELESRTICDPTGDCWVLENTQCH